MLGTVLSPAVWSSHPQMRCTCMSCPRRRILDSKSTMEPNGNQNYSQCLMKSSESRKFNPSPHTHLFTVQIRVVSPWLCSPIIGAFKISIRHKNCWSRYGFHPETWIDLVVFPHYMLEGGPRPEFGSDVCRIDRYAHTYIQVCSITLWTTVPGTCVWMIREEEGMGLRVLAVREALFPNQLCSPNTIPLNSLIVKYVRSFSGFSIKLHCSN